MKSSAINVTHIIHNKWHFFIHCGLHLKDLTFYSSWQKMEKTQAFFFSLSLSALIILSWPDIGIFAPSKFSELFLLLW